MSKAKICRGYVVTTNAVVVQCDLKFEEYDGPARVVKSAYRMGVDTDAIIGPFDWCVTRDAYVARASVHAKAKIKMIEESIEGHRADIKRMGGASYLEEAVKMNLVTVEAWRDVLRKIHNEGPSLYKFEETL